MNLSKSLITAVLMSAVAGSPAWAQHRNGAARGEAVSRSAPRAAEAPRAVAPSVAPRPQVVAGRTVAPSVAPRAAVVAPTYAQSRGVVVGRAVPRPAYGYAYARPAYAYHGYARPVYVAPVHFYHPYYAFHPHVSIGFGLWLGYPVPYAYSYYVPTYAPYYGYPYPYPAYPPAYPPPAPGYPQGGYPPPSNYPPSNYPPAANGSVVPQTNMGGLSFEIQPGNAEVFVDGNYVGTADQFTPTSQPLGLPAGRHHVEVRSPGLQTMVFEVDVVAGQVLPYRGTMQR